MKIDNKKNLLKTLTSVRAHWLEDNFPVVLYTTALQHNVYVVYIENNSTDAILRFMQNVDERLRTEVYFVIRSEQKPITTTYAYFESTNLVSNNKLVIVRTNGTSVPKVEYVAI